MSSRTAAKAEARAAREAAERRLDEAERRRRRMIQLGLATLAAVAIVGVLIAVSQSGSDSGGPVSGGDEAAALFRGIPQRGNVLGDPDAPATMVEYADLQCPYCAQYAGSVLPDVVRDYVRPGRLRLEFAPIAIIGPDSELGARAAVAAGLQNKMWQFTDVFYASQRAENSGYVDEAFIRDVATQVPGLDPARLLEDMDGAAAERSVTRHRARAQQLGVNATPTFFVARGNGSFRRLSIASLDFGSFSEPLDRISPAR
jgi:protein-disulfide isomerase